MRFEDMVLFATGGASGLGAATARRFADEGARVAVADIHPLTRCR
jgi:NAD(P)-dependent dehydrogenase (short-subunit alcohol dehydrogenase family)